MFIKQREAALLRYLMTNKKPVSLPELSERYNVSERTIRYDIDDLNYFLKELSAHIEIKKRDVLLILDADQEKLVKEKADLLLGIATPSAQSLANETQDIPIVITAVTDPVAAKLAKSLKKPGTNVTGTTDMVPIDKQIELLLSIVKDAKTIGIMYNSGEANSKIQADLAEKALKKANVKVKVLTANTTNDVQQVTTSLAKDVDGIYIPTDNTFASAAAVIGEVAKQTKTPIVAGSVEQVETGGLATYGIDYKELGKQTGLMAAKILDGKEKPATTAIESAKNLKLVVNEDMAKALGIDPASIVAPK